MASNEIRDASSVDILNPLQLQPTTICHRCSHLFTPSTVPPLSSTSLQYNYVPTETELRRVHNLIQADEHLVARYNEEIARLRQTMEKLEREKAVVESRIAQRHGFVSPLRRFPVEVLNQIFSYVCSLEERTKPGFADSASLSISPFRVTTPTLNLSHVCSRWRDIVIQKPSLWSSIDIKCIGEFREGDPRPLLSLYLERTQGCLLNLYFVSLWGSIEDEVIGHDLAWTAFQLFPRCKSLSLRCLKSAVFFDLIPRLEDNSLPHLQMFYSYNTGEGDRFNEGPGEIDNDESRSFWGAIRNAPNLITVGTSFTPSITTILPCDHLTSLAIESISVEDRPSWSHVFTALPHVQHLRLNFWDNHAGSTDTAETSVVELPDLRVLDISAGSHVHLQNVFGVLSTPALQSVNLELKYDVNPSIRPDPGQVAFAAMLERSSCKALQMIRISATPTAFHDSLTIARIARSCPNVISLAIDVIAFTDSSSKDWLSLDTTVANFFTALTTQPGNEHGTLFPKLNTLFITDLYFPNLMPGALEVLQRMAESRRTCGFLNIGLHLSIYPDMMLPAHQREAKKMELQAWFNGEEMRERLQRLGRLRVGVRIRL
ncbi:hypothetical protein PQX77_003156 [Marasmius sp. AFHP31]|nr:hypothetical protein PQX77_003156 [Marasmius sp. AFHP31]